MAKKSSKRASKPLAADEPAKPLDKPAGYGQRAGLAKSSATETQPVKPSAKPTPAEKPLTPTTTRSVRVSCVLLDLGANQVSLSGDFNGWSPSATPMRRDSIGNWETTIDLAPGRYQYKFVVDGEWIPVHPQVVGKC